MKLTILRPCLFIMMLGIIPTSVYAKCGGVNYSWGADALASMHDYVVTMMLYVLYICYALATVVGIISALQITIKMNIGEDGVKKAIMMLVGAILFIISASIVFPAFLDIESGSYKLIVSLLIKILCIRK